MRPMLALAVVTVLAGCGKKSAPDAAAEQTTEAAPKSAAMTATMPDTAEAKGFAKKLVGTTVSGWSPLDAASGGGELEYTEMTFEPSGLWNATANLELGDETLDCAEQGTWEIAEAEAKDTATMLWKLTKSDCPMRKAGTELRVQMAISASGSTKIMMH